MKKIVSILMVSLMISCLFACGKKASNEQASNNAVTNTEVANSASANVPAEYKQVTTNENGVKIYGKIVGTDNVISDNASPTMKNIYAKKTLEMEKANKNGWSYTFSEYYSEAYGGTVYLKTNAKNGSQEIYNEKGDAFIAGEAVTDMEKALANYRIGNAMADAMDKKIKGK